MLYALKIQCEDSGPEEMTQALEASALPGHFMVSNSIISRSTCGQTPRSCSIGHQERSGVPLVAARPPPHRSQKQGRALQRPKKLAVAARRSLSLQLASWETRETRFFSLFLSPATPPCRHHLCADSDQGRRCFVFLPATDQSDERRPFITLPVADQVKGLESGPSSSWRQTTRSCRGSS